MPFLNTVLLGVDSLVVGAAIGPTVPSADRFRLAATFGIADGLGFLAGWLVAWQLPPAVSDIARSALLILYGGYVLTLSAFGRQVARWPIWVLPWVLTLDNFAYGLGRRSGWSSTLTQAGEQAIASGALALLGLGLAIVLRRTQRRVAVTTTGVGLLVSAGLLLLT